MNKLEIIKWVRENQGLSKAEVSRAAGMSSGALSKDDTRGEALSEESVNRILNALQIEILDNDFKFKDHAFIKVRIGENILGAPNYSGLFNLLDKYKGKKMEIYMVEAIEKNLLDVLDRQFQEKIIREIPGNYMVININAGELLMFARRGGFRNYLTQKKQLEQDFLSEYKSKMITARDVDISLENADRDFVDKFLKKHRERRSGDGQN